MFDRRAYKREYMRDAREEKRMEELLTKGKCPVCEMFLSSDFHKLCPYLGDVTRKNSNNTRRLT